MARLGGDIEFARSFVHDIHEAVDKLEVELVDLTDRVNVQSSVNPSIRRFQTGILQYVSRIRDQIEAMNSLGRELEEDIKKFEQADVTL